eukprot:TRINITY_DN54460_c0_g1_i1.p2 TRINITY_DN54460_c0_g1~~TRINITY_DN54460_c0_g1_i1.p2  ORF type:complete len:107 (-),score=3.81 TRINITY_DN54460_c0_g1_i1:232-552(-)
MYDFVLPRIVESYDSAIIQLNWQAARHTQFCFGLVIPSTTAVKCQVKTHLLMLAFPRVKAAYSIGILEMRTMSRSTANDTGIFDSSATDGQATPHREPLKCIESKG